MFALCLGIALPAWGQRVQFPSMVGGASPPATFDPYASPLAQSPAAYSPYAPPGGYTTPPPGYAAPPGYPQQPAQNFPSQNPAVQPGWQNPFPPTNPAAPPHNPFASAQAPGYPSPAAPSFSAPTAPGPPSSNLPSSNAPSMPFLAMDVPARSGSSLHELTGGVPNVPGDWAEEGSLDEMVIWHIPCPKGHLLETPNDMLDQDVLCPFCETQFTLRKFQSVEETEKRERARALRDELTGQLWLKWAIGIAAVVILGVIIMIAVAASK